MLGSLARSWPKLLSSEKRPENCLIKPQGMGNMPRIALVVAGGEGRRLMPRTASIPKPLLRVGNVSILERILTQLAETGVVDIFVLTKHLHEILVASVDIIRRKLGVNVTCVQSSSDKINHINLVFLRSTSLSDYFILPGDHIFDHGILSLLNTCDTGGGLVLAVGSQARHLDCVEAKTVKVLMDGRTMKILEIGRDLQNFNAVDTGAYLWHANIKPLLKEYLSSPWLKPHSVSGFANLVAMLGCAKAIDVGEMKWVDIDREEDYLLAERLWGEPK
jgi:choline kinase